MGYALPISRSKSPLAVPPEGDDLRRFINEACYRGAFVVSGAFASVPLTQRAFRSPAGARVTFLLLAQKKSNPKKMAFKSESPAA
jgi:hypothetical protein